MIIEPENRRAKLESVGVPAAFLDAIDSPEQFKGLEFIAQKPEGTYFYLPDIYEDYDCLQGYDITPIYEGSNGDTFHVHFSNEHESKFVHFELEQDEIYDDFGSNFMYMLADLLIEYFEFDPDLGTEAFILYGEAMGFPNASQLFNALAQADRHTFELDAQWRREHLPEIIGDA